MRVALFFATVAILMAVASCQVITLTNRNFDKTVKKNDFVLVKFFTPWCGHCKTLKPEFEEAAKQTKGKYVLAKVDCTIETALCKRQGVESYPTLIFFKHGDKKVADLPRTSAGIVQWLDKKSGPIAKPLSTKEELEEFSKKTPSVIGFFQNENSKWYKNLVTTAEDQKVSDMHFGYTTNPELFGENKEERIEIHVAEGDDVVPSDINDDAESLTSFIFDSSFPYVQEITQSNYVKYANRQRPFYIAFLKTEDAAFQQNVAVLETVAKNFPQYSFGYLSYEKFPDDLVSMGASGKVIPAVVRISFTGDKSVAFEEEFTAEKLEQWIEDVIAGKVKHVAKSQPEPETNDAPVVTVVGSNFDRIVLDPSKDVLIEFYAPWCGHCKTLAPEFDKLGTAFKGVEDVVIAKVDSTENDLENSHYKVEGFPTILLYKRDDKTNPLVYKGQRNAKALANWLKKNVSSSNLGSIKKDEL